MKSILNSIRAGVRQLHKFIHLSFSRAISRTSLAIVLATVLLTTACGKIDTNLVQLQQRPETTITAPYEFNLCEGASETQPTSTTFSTLDNEIGGNVRIVSLSSHFELTDGGWDL
jgi:hypothetical protein